MERKFISKKTEVKRKKTIEEKKQYLFKRLGALIQGYKVRRILKSNKNVSHHLKEYRDLIKFAVQLKEELSDSIRKQSSLVGQIKLLLI